MLSAQYCATRAKQDTRECMRGGIFQAAQSGHLVGWSQSYDCVCLSGLTHAAEKTD